MIGQVQTLDDLCWSSSMQASETLLTPPVSIFENLKQKPKSIYNLILRVESTIP